jgi:O-antigen/teichoic acid export membrane protein
MILTIWQVDFKTIKYSIYQNLKTLLNATLSIILVFTLYKSWLGRIYGQLITYSIFIIVAITILHRKKYLFKQFNRDYLRDILLFGLPLIPHTLGTVLISFTDRFLITNLIGISTTGEYNVGYQVGQIINLLALSFNQAFVPWLFSQLSKKNEISRKKIVKLTYLYFIVILLLAIVLSLISPWFLAFFVGKEFNKSYIYVSWVAIGYAFQGMYLMVTNYIFFAKKNKVLAYVTFVTASLNVILTYVFIKLYGVIGAAISTSIVYFTQFLFTWYLSAKVFNMPWNIFKKLN